MRKKRLFIIEAPGKIKAFFRAAKQAYPNDDINVWATKGLIADLPTDEIALDALQYRVKKEVFNRNGNALLSSIRQKLGPDGHLPYDHICVCTDPDKEGEHIAGQVYRLLSQFSKERHIQRGIFETISPHGLLTMQTYPTPRSDVLNAREFRRVSDRIIPLFLSEKTGQKDWNGLGRVQFSTLHAIRELDRKWRPFKGEGYLEYNGASYWVETETDSEVSHLALLDIYRALRRGEAIVETTADSVLIPPPSPCTFASVFKRQPKDSLPTDIAEALQEAYMTGLVSYPRSMTTAYQPYTVDRLYEITRLLNLALFYSKDRLQDLKQDRRNLSEELSGHYGIHPNPEYDWGSLLATPESSLTQSQKVAKGILADACACIMEPAKMKVETLNISCQQQPGITLRAQRWIPEKKGFLAVYPRVQTAPPYPQLNPREGGPLHFSRRRPTRLEVVTELHKLGIGQAAQVVPALERLIETGLVSGYMKLTKKGSELLDKIDHTNPKLLENKKADRLLERLLLTVQIQPEQYLACAKELLSELDIDLAELDHTTPPGSDIGNAETDNKEPVYGKTDQELILEPDRSFSDFDMD